MKKLFLLSMMCIAALVMNAQSFVDLGLSSGTMWKDVNENGGFYTYEEAVSQFGNSLPTVEQWYELQTLCQWKRTGRMFKVTGPNGNSITLPAEGVRNCYGNVMSVNNDGNYWSSTLVGSGIIGKDPNDVWYLYFTFDSNEVFIWDGSRCSGRSVRLVQKKE